MLSKRSRFDASLNPLAKALVSHRDALRPLFDLTESNPTKAGVPYERERISAALGAESQLVYEPAPFGHPVARDAVARLWKSRGVAVDAERVVLTASTSEAYAFLFKVLCDPGDEVLVPSPSYPLFEHLARYESVRPVPYRLGYDGAWYVDVASLAAAVSKRSRAVVLVSPNNPTGSYAKRDELDAVAALGLPVISDEVFAAYPLKDDPSRPRTALERPGTLVFALDGLSKFGLLPQMKLAWITVGGPPHEVAEVLARLELLCDSFLSAGAAVQHGLPVLLEASSVPRAHVCERTRRNLDFLRERARGSPLTALDVEGGWYATLRLPSVRTEEQWTVGLLEEHDVLVQPGYFYDFETEPHVVLSLLTPEAVFREGAERLVALVDAVVT